MFALNDFVLAQLVLTVHLAAAAFITAGLLLIPLGARLHWAIAYAFWWRFFHFAAISAVALQKVLGKLCFLTVWEFDLLSRAGRSVTDVQPALAWADRLIHWDLPAWFFIALYALLWLYVAWLWWRIPPRRNMAGPATRSESNVVGPATRVPGAPH